MWRCVSPASIPSSMALMPRCGSPEWKRWPLAVRCHVMAPAVQGLALVHFSPQRKRFLWDRGCIPGLLRGCVVSVRGLLRGI